jgi:hypothetical protein
MAGIFLSYRRADSAAYAGRVGDALSRRFGRDQVFLDISNIEPGMGFSVCRSPAVGLVICSVYTFVATLLCGNVMRSL